MALERRELLPNDIDVLAYLRAMLVLTVGSITAKVVDTCPSCDKDHLDLSTGAFKALTGGQLDPPGQFNIQVRVNMERKLSIRLIRECSGTSTKCLSWGLETKTQQTYRCRS